uniref:Uncharacterized protein n=1 Tax=Desulfobacca acetoxidans TaxID=60893 RepID=A0A7C3SKV7_9BACT
MGRYTNAVVAVSLLALSGCLTYPYGGYYGYNGYPYYGNPYGYQSACPPSYGYSYDPYAGSQCGYGYSPGVAVPAPAPPVVVENYSGVVENSPDPRAYSSGDRRYRQWDRDRWTNRYSRTPGSDTSGNQQNSQDSASPSLPGESGQTTTDWRRDRLGNRMLPSGSAGSSASSTDQTQRPGAGYGSPATSASGQTFRSWQGSRDAKQTMNRNVGAQSPLSATPQVRPNMGTATPAPQMRQSPGRQFGGPATSSRMGAFASPAPRPMVTATPRTQPQVSQARLQVSSQPRATAREVRQKPQ